MARFSKYDVIGKIMEIGLIPIFYEGEIEIAKKIAQACYNGGAKVIEFANRGNFAHQVFIELEKWAAIKLPDLILGAGSVIDPATAALYINNGANFIVGPIFNLEVAKICNRRKIVYSPGCGTVSEISEAEEIGLDIIKIFPCGAVGPNFIREILGPCPWVRLMPTGGVNATRESVNEWIKGGAACLGIGSKLIRKSMVKSGNFEGITKKTEQVIWWIKEARGIPLFIGIEHVGIQTEQSTGAEIAEWYSETFGFDTKMEGYSPFFISGKEKGGLEIIGKSKPMSYHVAIQVSNFEEACKYLENRGIAIEEPEINKNTKVVYLKNSDPAGNRVNLFYKV